MSAPKEKEIARRLASLGAPEPPPNLLEKLKAEIPTHLEGVPELPAETPESPRDPDRSRLWLVAASLAVAVGGTFVAFQVQRQTVPSGLTAPLQEAAAPAPRSDGGQTSSDLRSPEALADNLSAGEEPAASRAAAAPGGASPELSSELRFSGQVAGPSPAAGADDGAADRQSALSRVDAATEAERDAARPATAAEGPSAQEVPITVVAPSEPLQIAPPGTPSRSQLPPPGVPLATARSFEAPAALGEELLDAEEGSIGAVEEGARPRDRNAPVTAAQAEAVRDDGSALRERRLEQLRKLEVPKPKAAPPPPSTGGSAEPNDQPYGDVFFRHEGTNPFVDTEEDRFSTFGLDVDSGSYTIGRRYLQGDHLPPAASVRVEEWINAFDYGVRPPRRGDFALRAEGSPTPFASARYRLLRLAIQGRSIDAEDRKPAVLTFVVDVSGSMDRQDRLGLVKESLELLLAQMRSSDRVGLVIFGSSGRVLLEPSSDLERIRAAIRRLVPGGSTNAEEGLTLGYELASRYFVQGGINRVILCSDGVANVGRTGPESILDRIRREAEKGVELTTLGFGMGNYNDVLMEQLADRGNGRYAYLDTLEEARRVLVEDLTGTLQTLASEARAQVEFNPATVERYRLLGYENRDIPDHRFRDDTVDAGEIGVGHTVTALYEIKLRAEESGGGRLATLRLRYRSARTGEFEELSREVRARDLAPSWERASRALRLASLVAEMAEILKGSYWAREGSLDEVFRLAQQLSPEFSGDERVAEFAALAGRAARLRRQAAR